MINLILRSRYGNQYEIVAGGMAHFVSVTREKQKLPLGEAISATSSVRLGDHWLSLLHKELGVTNTLLLSLLQNLQFPSFFVNCIKQLI